MRESRLAGRLGTLTAQLGKFGFGDVVLMDPDGKTFNAGSDPEATREVLTAYPGDIYMVPTDITKDPQVGFDNPDALQRMGMGAELVAQYTVFWSRALRPRGERIYPHDVHAVFLMAQLYGMMFDRPLYSYEPVYINGVSDDGGIDAAFGCGNESGPRRYVVTRQDPPAFRRLFGSVACTL